MKRTTILPIPVRKTLTQLGANLREARIKRNITMSLIEQRAGISHVTLTRVERGDSSVSMGIYAKVIFVLGLIDNLNEMVDPDNDIVGKMLSHRKLPKRVRYSKNEGL